ncbi:hypothetical protein F5J12DRAFT_942822 [Pisolithus orientalis]|uniref:uncharacterized protein n=1 Tax=Pisolithus orientalis TaxID=936130 RepID=UPI0022243BC1|nr:uncharacterized protein F5J12DRAFT_942822 [Pisolithus orientalis]KAI6004520.1 hypothetical protein F5J12DRAFT_942822 [Pisolithus orientalis]
MTHEESVVAIANGHLYTGSRRPWMALTAYWGNHRSRSRCLARGGCPTYSFQPRNGIGNTADIPTINFAIPNSDSRLQMRMTGRALAWIVRRYRLGQGLSHLSLRLPSSTSRACPARKGLRVFQEYMRSGLLASIDTSRTVGGMGERRQAGGVDGWRAEVSRAVGRLPSGFGSAFQVSHLLALTRLAQTRLGFSRLTHCVYKVSWEADIRFRRLFWLDSSIARNLRIRIMQPPTPHPPRVPWRLPPIKKHEYDWILGLLIRRCRRGHLGCNTCFHTEATDSSGSKVNIVVAAEDLVRMRKCGQMREICISLPARHVGQFALALMTSYAGVVQVVGCSGLVWARQRETMGKGSLATPPLESGNLLKNVSSATRLHHLHYVTGSNPGPAQFAVMLANLLFTSMVYTHELRQRLKESWIGVMRKGGGIVFDPNTTVRVSVINVRSWSSCSKTTDENPRPSTKTMFGNEGFYVDLNPIISADMLEDED